MRAEDGATLAEGYRENREHLEPWEPTRDEEFFTEARQRAQIEKTLEAFAADAALPLVLADGTRIVGRVNLTGIVRGAFQNANLGYWVGASHEGRGLMTAAVAATVQIARDELHLHRVQAATLLPNKASQSVLRKCGFTESGVAADYLCIAGSWQEHRLFQRILTT
ncbi:ribosomal-protein-alanine N-acetyltransferase [Curtobacterium luteum]|uniref:Ribosomal-protein-alanine N-acetyltransferase n=1 Tax=Curtobacterium luteum TaxID=33881 RepID=A0A8H9GD92_9MICO|nr:MULTISPECIES: GNAT family N-acetyltransferase [Curtobacterium]MBM7803398.1 ribosomal-protein-alanine N-acetyltransferase [Curtobacterium luteum]GGL11343.1 hypothetical protein GCM10009769_31790 [Curtobacterium luteum]